MHGEFIKHFHHYAEQIFVVLSLSVWTSQNIASFKGKAAYLLPHTVDVLYILIDIMHLDFSTTFLLSVFNSVS